MVYTSGFFKLELGQTGTYPVPILVMLLIGVIGFFVLAKTVLGRAPEEHEAPVILDEYANTSSAGSVIAFHRYHEDLSEGDIGVLSELAKFVERHFDDHGFSTTATVRSLKAARSAPMDRPSWLSWRSATACMPWAGRATASTRSPSASRTRPT